MPSTCLLCYEDSEHWVLPPCNHRDICWKCCLKLIDGSIFSCPFCKVHSNIFRVGQKPSRNCCLLPLLKCRRGIIRPSCAVIPSAAIKIPSTSIHVQQWQSTSRLRHHSTASDAEKFISRLISWESTSVQSIVCNSGTSARTQRGLLGQPPLYYWRAAPLFGPLVASSFAARRFELKWRGIALSPKLWILLQTLLWHWSFQNALADEFPFKVRSVWHQCTAIEVCLL